MISGARRVVCPESLDTAESEVAEANLRDLVRINSCLGGYRVLRSVLRPLVGAAEAFSVLDVGAASGDTSIAIRRAYPASTVVSLDRRALHLRRALPPRVAADALQLPFRERSFDFVTCSLFLHHFDDASVVHLIASLRRIARRALIAIDLERHPLAYYFLPATRWLFGWHPMTVQDGRISVGASFRAQELLELARAAGAPEAVVRRHRPWCRLSLVSPA